MLCISRPGMSRDQNSGPQSAAGTRRPRRGGRGGAPAWERGLDGGGGELHGLRVDDDVPAEQNAADGLPYIAGALCAAYERPQWSPPVNGGSTIQGYGAVADVQMTPQWSPPVNGGSTR